MTQKDQGLQTLNRICNLFSPGKRVISNEEYEDIHYGDGYLDDDWAAKEDINDFK